MHARLFDVLHDAGDQDLVAIAERIHVYFGGVFQESIDQDGTILREGHGLAHILADHLLVVGDDHGASAEHVAGTHQDRVAETAGGGAGLFHAGGGAVGGTGDS